MRLGLRHKPLVHGNPREITRADAAVLEDKRPTKYASVMKFRDSHHNVARMFAAGLRMPEIAERTGYGIQRIYTLARDPAFMELVAQKRVTVETAFAKEQESYAAYAMSNMLKAERMIADKLDAADEEGETLPTRELIAISRDAADRFGYGKKQTNVNVNIDFAARLEAAIKRSGKTINGEVAQSSVSRSQTEPAALPSPLSDAGGDPGEPPPSSLLHVAAAEAHPSFLSGEIRRRRL